jgi:hypothetical protein
VHWWCFWQAQTKERVVADVSIPISVRIWPTFGIMELIFSKKPQRNNLCHRLRVFLRKGGKKTISRWNLFAKCFKPFP